jgi:hypothetical protein
MQLVRRAGAMKNDAMRHSTRTGPAEHYPD